MNFVEEIGGYILLKIGWKWEIAWPSFERFKPSNVSFVGALAASFSVELQLAISISMSTASHKSNCKKMNFVEEIED